MYINAYVHAYFHKSIYVQYSTVQTGRYTCKISITPTYTRHIILFLTSSSVVVATLIFLLEDCRLPMNRSASVFSMNSRPMPSWRRMVSVAPSSTAKKTGICCSFKFISFLVSLVMAPLVVFVFFNSLREDDSVEVGERACFTTASPMRFTFPKRSLPNKPTIPSAATADVRKSICRGIHYNISDSKRL